MRGMEVVRRRRRRVRRCVVREMGGLNGMDVWRYGVDLWCGLFTWILRLIWTLTMNKCLSKIIMHIEWD